MKNIWKCIDTIEYTDLSMSNGATIKVVRDKIQRTFYFSLNDIFTSCGYSESNSYNCVRSKVYSNYYTPITYSYFPRTVFVSRNELPYFFKCAIDKMTGVDRVSRMPKKEKLRKICMNLVSECSESYLTAEKVKEKSNLQRHVLRFNRKPISFLYLNGKMMLHFRQLYSALGFGARSGYSELYTRFGEVISVNGNPTRYIPVRNLPAISAKLSYGDKLMDIYQVACKLSKSDADSASGTKSMVVYRNKGIAIYEGDTVIPIKVIEDEVHYKLASISRAYGLARTSEGMSKLAMQTDDGYYITVDDIEEYVDATPMPKIMKNSWNEFIAKMK